MQFVLPASGLESIQLVQNRNTPAWKNYFRSRSMPRIKRLS